MLASNRPVEQERATIFCETKDVSKEFASSLKAGKEWGKSLKRAQKSFNISKPKFN